MNIKSLLFLFCVGLFNKSAAQSSFQFGILPSINVNKTLTDKWKLNTKIESRQQFKEGTFDIEKEQSGYEYILTDIAIILSKKVGLNNGLAGGYLFRVRDNEVFHRLIQQFTVVQKHTGFRLAHRLAGDQTFSSESTEYRLRYRLTLELPLRGQLLDPKEPYLKINNEYLNALQESEYDLEIRLVPMLGYAFNDRNKVEAGLDYRINSFIADSANQRYWISINWYLSL